MSKPLVTFADAEAAVIDYLKAAFTGAIADRRPGRITADIPTAALAQDAQWVQVNLDASSADYPITERATVRVTCHTAPGHRSAASDLASLVQGLLLTYPGGGPAFSVRPGVGRSRPIVDPPTKNFMVWFTVRVNLRPVPVSL